MRLLWISGMLIGILAMSAVAQGQVAGQPAVKSPSVSQSTKPPATNAPKSHLATIYRYYPKTYGDESVYERYHPYAEPYPAYGAYQVYPQGTYGYSPYNYYGYSPYNYNGYAPYYYRPYYCTQPYHFGIRGGYPPTMVY
jgi:hypothetical protein